MAKSLGNLTSQKHISEGPTYLKHTKNHNNRTEDVIREQNERLNALISKENFHECTFHPKTNKNSIEIANNKDYDNKFKRKEFDLVKTYLIQKSNDIKQQLTNNIYPEIYT